MICESIDLNQSQNTDQTSQTPQKTCQSSYSFFTATTQADLSGNNSLVLVKNSMTQSQQKIPQAKVYYQSEQKQIQQVQQRTRKLSQSYAINNNTTPNKPQQPIQIQQVQQQYNIKNQAIQQQQQQQYQKQHYLPQQQNIPKNAQPIVYIRKLPNGMQQQIIYPAQNIQQPQYVQQSVYVQQKSNQQAPQNIIRQQQQQQQQIQQQHIQQQNQQMKIQYAQNQHKQEIKKQPKKSEEVKYEYPILQHPNSNYQHGFKRLEGVELTQSIIL